MARYKNGQWSLPDSQVNWEQVGVAVLMDIRDELNEIKQTLKESNQSLAVLRCSNFIDIPRKLDKIRLNTTKPARKTKRVKT